MAWLRAVIKASGKTEQDTGVRVSAGGVRGQVTPSRPPTIDFPAPNKWGQVGPLYIQAKTRSISLPLFISPHIFFSFLPSSLSCRYFFSSVNLLPISLGFSVQCFLYLYTFCLRGFRKSYFKFIFSCYFSISTQRK